MRGGTSGRMPAGALVLAALSAGALALPPVPGDPRPPSPTHRPLLSVSLVAFYEWCPHYKCQLVHWAASAAIFARGVREATGREAVVDMYTDCREAGAARTRDGVLVTVHDRVPADLVAAVANFAKKFAERRRLIKVFYKLVAWARTDVEFVLVSDLDVDLAAPGSERLGPQGMAPWVEVFKSMRAAPAVVLLSHPDVSAPVNGGFLLFRPSAYVYAESLALLSRPGPLASLYNATHGWELLGRPLELMAPDDPARTFRMPGQRQAAHVVRRNDWAVHGETLEQGLLFHVARLKHRPRIGRHYPCLALPTGEGSGGAPVPAPRRALSWGYVHYYEKPFLSYRGCTHSNWTFCPRPEYLYAFLGHAAGRAEGARGDPALGKPDFVAGCAAHLRAFAADLRRHLLPAVPEAQLTMGATWEQWSVRPFLEPMCEPFADP